MQIVLYYAPIACSMVPYINLTEAGANFEVRPINLAKANHGVIDGRCHKRQRRQALLIGKRSKLYL